MQKPWYKQALGDSSPKMESFALYKNKASSLKKADLWNMVKKGLQVCLHISCSGNSWPFITYCINFFRYEASRKHRRGPLLPKPADEGDSQIEYSTD